MIRPRPTLEWGRVQALVGRTLPTHVSPDLTFTIQEVTPDLLTATSVRYSPEHVKRQDLESIWQLLSQRRQVPFEDARRVCDSWWRGHIALGTLAEMPQVGVRGDGPAANLILLEPGGKVDPLRQRSDREEGSDHQTHLRSRILRLQPGQTFGKYKILEEIGRGGMGRVYKAAVLAAGSRTVAIKAAGLENELSDADFARFRREVKALGNLSPHANIIKLLDRYKGADPPFFVMEFAECGNLRAKLAQEPLSAAAGRAIFESVCTAISFAHSQGVVHRDLKRLCPEGCGLWSARLPANRLTYPPPFGGEQLRWSV